jgi:transcriptional regulator of acetoin/glycerol metabolism
MSEENIIPPDDLIVQKSDKNLKLTDKPISLNEAEKIVIANAIKRNRGNLSAVSKELGIVRQTLYRKMKDYGL